ncbi:NAD(P)-dependent oxidoreductase [Streptomyces sp. NPDC051561]|uniref:NAD(P)-dependent oxidoreductase n=1 Tax=Streptomyces sp. NPDC051561 TaxID=3365658 RepID=UPI00379F87B2
MNTPVNTSVNTKAPVTVLGLGLMGSALADALLTAGHRVTVWNRTPTKADALVARGAVRAGSVREALEASPLTLSCLLDYDTQRAVLDPAAGALHGRTLVSLTNGSPAQARETETWAHALGASYLDGGIMAIPSMIAGPGAFILYSGARDPFDAHRATLEVLAEAKYLGTDVGTAALYDLALLSSMDMMFAGFFHAVAMATSHKGTTASGFTELLVDWLTSMVHSLPAMAADIDSDDPPSYEQTLELVLAAARNMGDASREAGVRSDWFDREVTELEARIAAGHTMHSAPESVRLLKVAGS